MSDGKRLSDYVAGEIRATLARGRTTGRELAEKLGVSRSWVSYRLTGTTEITLNDLEKIAGALGVGVSSLLPQEARSQTTREYVRQPKRMIGQRTVTRPTSPNSRPPVHAGNTRPISAPPASGPGRRVERIVKR